MRILHLNSLLTGGGTDEQCVQQAIALRRLGEEVFFVGPGRAHYRRLLEEGRVPHERLSSSSKLLLVLRSAQAIRSLKANIVHGHHGRDIWPTIIAAKLSGRRPRIVISRHMAKSPGSVVSRKFLLGQCDALVAVSEFVAEVLKRGHSDPASPERERHQRLPIEGDHSKIHVVYGGIDTKCFRPVELSPLRTEWSLEPHHFVFAVVGGYALPRGKGQREFLQAAARIKDLIPEARFLIIGRGSMKQILERDIDRLGLQGRAWLTPYCEQMPQAMNAIDCLVHPQIGTEAFGLVVCEAFACGKPVIASALDGIPEAFACCNYGKLVTRESVDSLASAMVEIARQPRLNLTQREQLHAAVEERFSIETSAKSVRRLYRKLLHQD